MNFNVLKEVNYTPEQWETAKLHGFDIVIQPRANLVRSESRCVYGLVASATHQELGRLYDHAQNVLGEIYLPEAVLVETAGGKWKPALCYICPAMQSRPAAGDYIDRIVGPAREFKFPEWYIERLENFRP
jgi:hypothetical protein